jgi:hypothetical protein
MSRTSFPSVGVILSVVLTGPAGCSRPLAVSKPDGAAAVAHDGSTAVSHDAGTAIADGGPSSGDAARDAAVAVDVMPSIDASTETSDVTDARLDAADAPPSLAPNQYRAIAIVMGRYHTCALLDDHRVKCWGDNGYGQLGLGDRTTRGVDPTSMGNALPTVDLGTGRTAKSLAAGRYATCAILDDDSLKCWGLGSLAVPGGTWNGDDIGTAPGEMGDNLRPIDLGTGRKAIAVAIGFAVTSVARDDGSFLCWDTSNESAEVVAPSDGARVVQLAGDYVTVGVFDDGSVRRIYTGPPGLTLVDFGGRFATFVAGLSAPSSENDCAILREGGTACTWDQNNPSVPTSASVVDIAITEYGHACGIDPAGVVRCWNLPLGDSDPQWANRPGDTTARVARLGQPATSLSAGDYNVCALLANGTVKCWGIDGAYPQSLGGSVATSTGWPAVDLGTRPAP